MNIAAVRNEYENAQVILTAEKDVKSYTVTLSDLTGAAGTFKKENFKIYNQKYIEVTKTTTNAFTSGGIRMRFCRWRRRKSTGKIP